MQHVYIVGSKSIGQYGGFETFVMWLLENHKDNEEIKYHVACKANGNGHMDVSGLPEAKMINKKEFEYLNAHCFLIGVPQGLGCAQAIYYDIAALNFCCKDVENRHIQHPIVYILASRIGPFERKYVKRIHKAGGEIYQNPDGHEYLRGRWNAVIKRYWKYSERLMIKNCDLAICDSENIQRYIQKEYKRYHPNTAYIAYGSDEKPSVLADDDPVYVDWLDKHGIHGSYYVSVGRFVPENNFETMIREFMKSKTDKDFVIITTSDAKFFRALDKKLDFKRDGRIKFVGTVYDQELLKKIRENAYGYFHGHQVGGTNPSLLEALLSTKLNLLLEVGFNREVAKEAALYWTKKEGELAALIDKADGLNKQEIEVLSSKARERIREAYSWELVSGEYAKVFRGMRCR